MTMKKQVSDSSFAWTRTRGHGRGFTVMAFLIVCLLASSACSRRQVAASVTPPAVQPAPPPAPAPSITLTASPATINSGISSSLQWEARNASSVRIEPSIGSVSVSGTQTVTPAASVTYTATAMGPGGTASDSVRITVNAPPPAAAAAPPASRVPTVEDLFRENVLPVYFDYDRAEIRPDQVGRLQANARFLRENVNVLFTINGHADERGSQEYNIGLGDLRANSVRQFLADQGIAVARIQIVSYGEDRPVCMEPNEGCWSRNRRAEFVLR